MSWNNVIPAWMVAKEFSEAYYLYDTLQISQAEFYRRIKDLAYVPNAVKQNWRNKLDDDELEELESSET